MVIRVQSHQRGVIDDDQRAITEAFDATRVISLYGRETPTIVVIRPSVLSRDVFQRTCQKRLRDIEDASEVRRNNAGAEALQVHEDVVISYGVKNGAKSARPSLVLVSS